MTRNNYAVMLAVILLDQAGKWLARKNYFSLQNSSLPFSLDLGRVFNLFVLSAALFAFIFLYQRFWKGRSPWGFALIVGGALSNLLDRIFSGSVTDFINISISTINMADIAIGIGIFVLISNS